MNHNNELKYNGKLITKRSALMLENEDSILDDTLKIESIRPVTSIKLSPTKQNKENNKTLHSELYKYK